MNTKLNKFEKLKIAARYWLLGMAEKDPEYFDVIEAMEYGLQHHDGLRNGGDHEFIHQLQIFHRLRTLHRHIRNPVLVYILVFLHDAVEDPNHATKKFISLDEVKVRWGNTVAVKVKMLSKEILGQPNPDYSLDVIFEDEDCSIVKAGDRADNVSTMFGVFKRARLERYIKETVEEFLGRIKAARRRFPDQEGVYENVKMQLIQQLQLIQHILEQEDSEDVTTP